jgi:pimeloyl-ACP methyl ester carboxylesterase
VVISDGKWRPPGARRGTRSSPSSPGGTRAIRYDLRGFGASGPRVAGYRNIAAALEEAVPGAEREEFADAGHLLNLEQPERFTRRLMAFLQVN